MRDGQVQISPWFRANMEKPSSALSKNSSSASMTSAKKMFGLLPPSSTVEGIRLSAAACRMRWPTGVEPVKAIFAMRLLVAKASPASRP